MNNTVLCLCLHESVHRSKPFILPKFIAIFMYECIHVICICTYMYRYVMDR